MMSKIEKIWLWISAAMFLIPEILWFTISNVLSNFFGNNDPIIFLRINFVNMQGYSFLYKAVVFFQLLGSLGFIFFLIKYKNMNKIIYCILLFIGILVFFISLFSFYLINFFKINF
jgi:hypothetical protein